MSTEIKPIDLTSLVQVTGGSYHGHGHGSGSGSPVLGDLSAIASQISDLTNKTSGFSSTQMLLMVAVMAMRNNGGGGFFGGGCGATNVVYYSGRPRCW